MKTCKDIQPQVHSDLDNEVIRLHNEITNLKEDSTLVDVENRDLQLDITDKGSEHSNCVTCVEGFVLLQEMENHILAHQFCG